MQPNVREDVISGISWFGCDVDPEKNVFGVTGDISTDAAKSVSWLFQQMKN